MGRLSAVKRVIDRCGYRRVADAHFAHAQKINLARNRFHAKGEGRGGALLVQRGALRDVAGGHIERQIKHFEAKVIRGANLVDRATASGERLHHLPGDGLRPGAHALLNHAMIGGKDSHQRTVHGRARLALPGGHPLRQFLHAPQGASGLDEHGIALAHKVHAILRRRRHDRKQSANIVERQAGGGHGDFPHEVVGGLTIKRPRGNCGD